MIRFFNTFYHLLLFALEGNKGDRTFMVNTTPVPPG